MDSHECVPASSVCLKCGEVKPQGEFYFRADRGTYIRQCKTCYGQVSNARYLRNKPSVLARQAKRRIVKKDEIADYQRRWYLQNRDRALTRITAYRAIPEVAEREKQRQAAYYAARATDIQAKRRASMTPERLTAYKQYQAEWAKANKALLNAKSQRRRADRMRATPEWVDLNAVLDVYIAAANATMETGEPHEVDHIVPLCGKTVCGLHVPWNLRVIHRSENRRKSNKLDG